MKTIIEPFRIKSVEPLRLTTRGGAQGPLARRPLQPFRALFRRRADRPADRFRHFGDEREAVGGDHARRRELRRFALLPPLRAGGAPPHAVPPHHPDASGPRGRGDPVSSDRRTRTQDSRRTPISTPRAAISKRPAPRRSTCQRRKDATRRRPIRSRATWTSTRLEAFLAREWRRRPLRHADGHQQRRRRPAGFARQHPRGGGTGASIRQAVHHRRLPLRRERLVHQAARAGPAGRGPSSTSCATCSRSPTA